MFMSRNYLCKKVNCVFFFLTELILYFFVLIFQFSEKDLEFGREVIKVWSKKLINLLSLITWLKWTIMQESRHCSWVMTFMQFEWTLRTKVNNKKLSLLAYGWRQGEQLRMAGRISWNWISCNKGNTIQKIGQLLILIEW
jgi:hypothetical protein